MCAFVTREINEQNAARRAPPSRVFGRAVLAPSASRVVDQGAGTGPGFARLFARALAAESVNTTVAM